MPGAKAGAIFDHEEAAALARLLITPAVPVSTRETVPTREPVLVPAGTSPRASGPAGARRAAWRWGLLLAGGWLLQAGLRAWLSRAQVAPLANPDETAYLIAARVLAGGPAANLSGSTLYQGGYPLLITPVYWFTSNPVTVYHAVLMINAVISALVLPLGYLAVRRLGLDRPAAYGVAMIAALVPAAFFYSEYALADAIFPVITLAWLLALHSWLTARSRRAGYAAAVGSALLTGFSYAVHSRGLVLLVLFAAMGALIAWRRPAARGSVAAAGLTALLAVAAAWALNRYLTAAIYPQGARSLSGQLLSNLASVRGAIHALEMAAGQLWRLTLDSWGIAGIGLIAALAAIVRRGLRSDLRIMAALAVAVTVLIACIAPAALPAGQSATWASGRYLDGMIVTFFLVGAAVLLRASTSRILGYAACATGLTVLAAVTVAVYAGTSLSLAGFGNPFNFAEPAVLTQNWTQASVLVATAVAVGLLALWVGAVLIARRWRGIMLAGGLGLAGLGVAAVSLVALVQMTSHISQAGTATQTADTTSIVAASGLKPGEQIAIASGVRWGLWVPQEFEIYWTQPEFFNPASQPPPADVSVVETPWPATGPASASWPNAPAGWRVVASNRAGGWVAWRDS
jgi:hypothetical protein